MTKPYREELDEQTEDVLLFKLNLGMAAVLFFCHRCSSKQLSSSDLDLILFVRIRPNKSGSGQIDPAPAKYIRIRPNISGSGQIYLDPAKYIRIRPNISVSGQIDPDPDKQIRIWANRQFLDPYAKHHETSKLSCFSFYRW